MNTVFPSRVYLYGRAGRGDIRYERDYTKPQIRRAMLCTSNSSPSLLSSFFSSSFSSTCTVEIDGCCAGMLPIATDGFDAFPYSFGPPSPASSATLALIWSLNLYAITAKRPTITTPAIGPAIEPASTAAASAAIGSDGGGNDGGGGGNDGGNNGGADGGADGGGADGGEGGSGGADGGLGGVGGVGGGDGGGGDGGGGGDDGGGGDGGGRRGGEGGGGLGGGHTHEQPCNVTPPPPPPQKNGSQNAPEHLLQFQESALTPWHVQPACAATRPMRATSTVSLSIVRLAGRTNNAWSTCLEHYLQVGKFRRTKCD